MADCLTSHCGWVGIRHRTAAREHPMESRAASMSKASRSLSMASASASARHRGAELTVTRRHLSVTTSLSLVRGTEKGKCAAAMASLNSRGTHAMASLAR